MKYFLGIILSLAAITAFAQERPLVQFSGIVVSTDSSSVIPFTSITNLNYPKQGAMANYKGYFSFVAHQLDTIKFTSIGYAPTTIVIPAGVKDASYTLKVRLIAQTTHLPGIKIFPWATTDEFRKDFLTMKVADDDLAIAYKNLSGKSVAAISKTLPMDGQEHQEMFAQDEHNAILNSHSLQPNPLLNPFAWASLIKEITAGDKSRGVSTDN